MVLMTLILSIQILVCTSSTTHKLSRMEIDVSGAEILGEAQQLRMVQNQIKELETVNVQLRRRLHAASSEQKCLSEKLASLGYLASEDDSVSQGHLRLRGGTNAKRAIVCSPEMSTIAHLSRGLALR